MSDVTGSSPAATAADSSPASPAPITPAPESTPASASVTPPSEPSAGVPGTEQHVPYARFKEVNDELRAMREFKKQYEWAEGFQKDPFPYLDQWLDQAAGHQDLGPKVLAKAARMLAARRGSTPSDEPQPDVPIVDAQGTVTGQTYSAAQLKKWQEWNWQQRETALNERLQPLEQMRQAEIQRQQQAEQERQSAEWATGVLTKLRTSPVYQQHESAFNKFFAEHEEFGADINAAWWTFYESTVLPTLSQTEQKKVLDSLSTKAAGATVNPGSAVPTTKKTFKSFAEAMAHYDAHPEEAEAMASRRR